VVVVEPLVPVEVEPEPQLFEPGMVSRCPIDTRLGLLMPFALMMACIDTPHLTAMPESVSPACTT